MNFTATMRQSCGSTSRLIVHNDIVDDVVSQIVTMVEQIRSGDPTLNDTETGPLVSKSHYKRVLAAIDSGRAQVAVGGGRPTRVGEVGYFVAPTVLTNVGPQTEIARTEVFGPVLSVMTFTDSDEAIRLANDVA